MKLQAKLGVTIVMASFLVVSCGDTAPSSTSPQNSSVNSSQAAARASAAPAASSEIPSVASSHGSGRDAAKGAPASEKPPVETPELDAKVESTVAKANRAGASSSDKKAAADAHLARGNFYYNAQDTRLYRYALGDFRRVLRYEPANAEAKEKIDTIVGIYESLGRPIPTNGLEP